MESTEALSRYQRRLSVDLFVYVVFFVFLEYAHGQIDRLWSMGAQISSLSVFAMVPLLGALLLWSKSSRFGGILILGSLPSSVLYLIMDRFVEKRIAMAPAVPVPGWQLTYNVLYVLVIACAAVGALLAAQFLREFHREEKRSPA